MIKTSWQWLKKYWYVPFAAIGFILIAVYTRRSPGAAILSEIRAADAKERTRKIEAEKGAEAALRDVQDHYRARLRQLDIEALARADAMRNDPVALAAWLERIVAR